MKIVFFINNVSNSGGSERAAVVIANKLCAIGHEVTAVTWMGGSVSFFPFDPRIKIIALNKKTVNIYTNYIFTLFKYIKVVKQIKPDWVIDVCTTMTLFSAPLKLFVNVKIASWEHFNTNVNWNLITSRLSRWLAARSAEKLIVLTEADRRNFIRFFGAKNTVCIPNPLTVTPIQQASLDAKICLAIGRFSPQKGFDLLLKAWRLVIDKQADWKLNILGDGEMKPQLQKLIQDLNLEKNVDLIPPTLQVENYYASSSIFVMSSRFEGLPLVLIEAKSFGLPIVSFDCETGPREIVRNGVDGILVEPENIVALSNSILQLIENPDQRKLFGASALEDLKRFDIDQIIGEWELILAKK